MDDRKRIGKSGENQAEQFLKSYGLEVLGTNVKLSSGEIDIIARDNATIIFVEVKTRSSTSFAEPEASVNKKKIIHLIACADEYMQLNPHLGEFWRIDVIAITHQHDEERKKIVWYKNAVSD